MTNVAIRLGPIVCAAVALGWAQPAPAAGPFTAGAGADPSIAVGPDGTGHVVWATRGPGSQVGYCRVAPGAAQCDRTENLTFPNASAARPTGRPRVFAPSGTKVVIVAGCTSCGGNTALNRIYRWVSTDSGTTFPAGPAEISHVFQTRGFGTWLDDLGIFVGVDGPRVKAMGDVADAGQGVQYATGSGSYAYGPEVVRVPGTTRLVAAVNNLSVIKYAVYTGGGDAAQMNSAGSWLLDRSLPAAEADTDDSALNSGPSGVYLSYRVDVSGNGRVGLRRLDPAANEFGSPMYVEGDDPIDDPLAEPDSFQDPSGRIHLAWRSSHDGGRLRYRVLDPRAGNPGPVRDLAARETFVEPELAAGSDGTGFAVWTQTSGSVRIVPLAGLAPSAYAGAFRTLRFPIRGATLLLTIPRDCLQPKQSFPATLRWRRVKLRGNPFVRVRRAAFRLGTARAVVDARRPFVQSLTVSPAATAGTTVVLHVRALIENRRGRPTSKSVRVRLRICT